MRFIVTALTAFLLIATSARQSSAGCDSPRFRIGRVDKESPTSLVMNISLDRADAGLAKILCLAATLKARYNERDILVVMLANPEAAKFFSATGLVPEGGRSYFADVLATYFFDSHADRNEIGIGSFAAPETVISLPVNGSPQCLTEISQRCLWQMDLLRYPAAARLDGTSASVTVSGVIGSDGTVTHVRVVTATSNPPGHDADFVEECLRHAKTWRFEKATKETGFRTTYSWSSENVASASEVTRMDLALPERVSLIIRLQ